MRKYDETTLITTTEDITYCTPLVCKLLAGVGYDVFCKNSWTHYHKSTKYYRKDSYQFDSMSGTNSIHGTMNNEYYTTYASPQQEQVKHWLRTIHKIEVEIKYNSGGKEYEWRVFCQGRYLFQPQVSIVLNDNQKKYEIAFEHGLKAALDQIKIIKDKKQK